MFLRRTQFVFHPGPDMIQPLRGLFAPVAGKRYVEFAGYAVVEELKRQVLRALIFARLLILLAKSGS